MIKKILFSFFYLILLIYSFEALSFLFKKNKGLDLVTINNTRKEIASDQGLNFDSRSSEDAFLDISKKNKKLKPKFFYSPIFKDSKIFQEAKIKNNLIPFRGPINAKTLSCAEEGEYHLDNSDKYGFKNYNYIYESQINTMLLGDSLAEGNCQKMENNIAGHLNKRGHITVNYGVTGTSLLIALGIMREFSIKIKPKNYVYLYSEQNDLLGLNWSKKDSHLMNYLNEDYNVKYLERYDEINNFLKLVSEETISKIKSHEKNQKVKIKKTFDIFQENLIDILELKRIKYFIRYSILKKKHIDIDMNLFFLALKELDKEAKKNKGNFIFVYLPNPEKYFLKKKDISLVNVELANQKNIILDKLKEMSISTIDMSIFFDTVDLPQSYFSLGYLGHFNSKGYETISNYISERLK